MTKPSKPLEAAGKAGEGCGVTGSCQDCGNTAKCLKRYSACILAFLEAAHDGISCALDPLFDSPLKAAACADYMIEELERLAGGGK